MELKIGDIVRLNSDIHAKVLMTINGYSHNGDDFWYCVWFNNNELIGGNFHKSALSIFK